MVSAAIGSGTTQGIRMKIGPGGTIGTSKAILGIARANAESSTAIERLASGLRINKASDDAAGLAIADSLRVQTRLSSRALLNIADSSSLLAVAETALSELQGIVTRISELAEQSANGTYNTKQRQSLDREAQQLSAEFSRIVSSTSFNGVRLFDGSQSVINTQVGNDSSTASRVVLNTGLQGTTVSGTGNYTQIGAFATTNSAAIFTNADYNGDGFQDLVNVATASRILLGNGDGTFVANQLLSATATDLARSADLDNDGDTDIFTVESDNVRVYTNDGSGSFSASTQGTDAGVFMNDARAADVNGDSNLDILLYSRNSDMVYVRLGNGNGTFKAVATYTIAADSRIGQFGDVNGDGVLDMLVTGDSTNYQGYLVGNSDGSFGATLALETSAFATTVQIFADIDGNGYDDIIQTDAFGANGIRAMLSNGNGTFKASATIVATSQLGVPVFADLNGDGALDLLRPTTSNANTLVYLNDGAGGFSLQNTLAISSGNASSVTAVDLNDDTILDIVVSTGATGTVVSFLADTVESEGGPLELGTVSLLDQSSARSTIDTLESTRDRISQLLGNIGAGQARLKSAAAQLLVARDEFAAAESRIRAVDVAVESGKLLRAQILTQSNAALLSHVKSEYSIMITLLKGD